MNAITRPSADARARMRREQETASLVTQAADLDLDERGLALATLIGYPDEMIREAVKAAVGGARAARGFSGPPRVSDPPEITHVAWCRYPDSDWTAAFRATEDGADGYVARMTEYAAEAATGAEYLSLPLRERPPADPDDHRTEAEIGRDIRNTCGGWA